MCGRFALTLPPQAIRALFALDEVEPFPPRFNIAPGQPILVASARRDGSRRLALARWGFSPNTPGRTAHPAFLVNARAESVQEKPSFRAAFRRRRCLVPADAFYEWHREGTDAQPFLFRRADGAPFAMAALREHWTGPNGEEVETVCIVTTAANEATAAIHPRLPALIEPADFALWLDPDENYSARAHDLLRPAPVDHLVWCPIDRLVNKTANEGPRVQQPAAAPREAAPAQGSLF